MRHTTTTNSNTLHSLSPAEQRRSTMGAFVGTAIEWYDFFLFSTASALVLGKVFFPVLSPGIGILVSFATFWVGFLLKPLGGIIFSHFGDKYGRKNTLLFTLLMMGVATSLIGCLPGYANIGIAAPIMLVILRAIQGLASGGEWGGAVALVTENVPEEKRHAAGVWVQQGSPVGSILATAAFALVGLMPDEAFFSWGWRIPFLVTAVLLLFSFWIRRNVAESTEFQAVKEAGNTAKVPLVDCMKFAPAALFYGFLAAAFSSSGAYFNNTFLVSWTTNLLGMDRTVILNIALAAAIVQLVWQPFVPKITEKLGSSNRVMMLGLALSLAFCYPFFLAIQSGNAVFLCIMMMLNMVVSCSYYAMLASSLSEAFPAEYRYTGVTMANSVSAMIFGGATPVIGQWILNSSGGNAWAVMAFYGACIVLTGAGVVGLMWLQIRKSASRRNREHPGMVEERESP